MLCITKHVVFYLGWYHLHKSISIDTDILLFFFDEDENIVLQSMLCLILAGIIHAIIKSIDLDTLLFFFDEDKSASLVPSRNS